MNRLFFSMALAAPLVGSALEVKPWLGNEWEFQFDAAYTYSHYPNVQNGHPALRRSSNDQLLTFDLGTVVMTPNLDIQLEAEFADTPRQRWGVRSTAAQVRYQWLNDIPGDDPVSLTTGANLRFVARHSLHDVSCPYHSDVNFELNASLGKEWSRCASWSWRSFAFGGVGIANHGSPWLRALFAIEKNQQNCHQYGLFAGGYFGFGGQRKVRTRHFDGYGKIHHQSIDLGLGYRYLLGLYGSLSFNYAYRVFARSFPEHVNFFTVAYNIPFSPF
jgi:hypothetical protein